MSISKTLLITIIAAAMCTPAMSQRGGKGGSAAIFKKLDKDKDGKISAEEAKGSRIEKAFDKIDADDDGYITKKEMAAAKKGRKGRKGGQRKKRGGKGGK